MKKLYFVGICGTFMASLALLAKELGFEVSGVDENIYPPMSDILANNNIKTYIGYSVADLPQDIDLFIIGNAISRGNAIAEHILNNKLNYTSGPEFLRDNILKNKIVLAVAGTHGKTTTSSMLAWILQYNNLNPGYLIGGAPNNFDSSAKLGQSQYFVIEADEYDTAFFDKRSKFIHYKADVLILNNLEFDHGDIFSDLNAIKTSFRHLLRTIPGNGTVIYNKQDDNLNEIIALDLHSKAISFNNKSTDYSYKLITPDASQFEIYKDNTKVGVVKYNLIGEHNASNAMAAIIAAKQIGIEYFQACNALSEFKGVKKRLELLYDTNNIKIYQDFAHHPTAIATTLAALKANNSDNKIVIALDFRSNTMKMGQHQKDLLQAFNHADKIIFYNNKKLTWDIATLARAIGEKVCIIDTIQLAVAKITKHLQNNTTVVLMSNGNFDNLGDNLLQAINK